jgi:hypothetical protein
VTRRVRLVDEEQEKAVTTILEIALAALLIFGGGFLIAEGRSLIASTKKAWPPVVCWANDESRSLSRTCAAYKISRSSEYEGEEVIEVTGIADMSENVKKVEFRWRLKPDAGTLNAQAVDASMTFRRYDDGWRPSQ